MGCRSEQSCAVVTSASRARARSRVRGGWSFLVGLMRERSAGIMLKHEYRTIILLYRLVSILCTIVRIYNYIVDKFVQKGNFA